jgi:plastocyanin
MGWIRARRAAILDPESGYVMRRSIRRFAVAAALLASPAMVVTLVATTPGGASSGNQVGANHTVNIPGTDKFVPFHLTIHAGDTVTWVNSDTDDHTVVADGPFTDTDNNGVNHLIPGTDNNNGQPGTFRLEFDHPGTFVYYCRFHSMLDADNQPIAPGPRGGIQDSNNNFGTPMSGVITVVSGQNEQ